MKNKHAGKICGEQDFQWLYKEAKRILKKARLTASDGTVLYSPGVYRGVWLRDFEFVTHNVPELLTPPEIKAIYYYVLDRQKGNGAVPVSVSPDGKPNYRCWGAQKTTDADATQYLVKIAYDYYRYTNDIELFASTSQHLKRAMDFMPRSSLGLIYIDPEFPHTPFGFTDNIIKTGNELFCSLLYWEASRILAELFAKTGNRKAALDFTERAALIEKNMNVLWDDKKGAYLASSISARKVDIWGNAYMVYLGFPTHHRERVIDFLAAHEKQYVYCGQVRHLLKGEYWDAMIKDSHWILPDEYQNGGYWATASGWVLYALALKYPKKAERMAADLTGFFRANGIYECVNEKNYRKYPDYVASIVNPVGMLKHLGAGLTS